jgi:hypothetical protein
MTRLFDHDDWSRFDNPEADAPAFLSDTFDSLPFEPIRDTIVVTAAERDIQPSPDSVVDVFGPDDDGSAHSVPRELPVPLPSMSPGWYSDWSAEASAAGTAYPPYHAGIDIRPDTRYASYEPYRSDADEWDPLTDPWPIDQRMIEPPLSDPSPPTSPEPPTQNLVYPDAGFSEARYAETRHVETSFAGRPYAESRSVEPQAGEAQPSWFRDAGPSVPAQSRVEEPLAAAPLSVDPQDYDVVLPGPLGDLEIAFRDANWYSLSSHAPRPLRIRDVLASHPQHAGTIVQVVCWWMRENSGSERALDLATELALAVADFARGGTGLRRAI